jgi:hypothetical protein
VAGLVSVQFAFKKSSEPAPTVAAPGMGPYIFYGITDRNQLGSFHRP